MLKIYLEYVGLKSIDIMINEFGAFRESVVKSYTKQMLEGLQYLHYKGIIHRDIKGGNILVNCKGIVKMSDFGCAKCLSSGLNSYAGSVAYMSPEMYLGKAYGRYSDIWSLGCSVYEMCTGKSPFYKRSKDIPNFNIGMVNFDQIKSS